MLGGENERAGAGSLRGACPLTRIESGWREDGRIFVPVTPLAISEGVHTEVEEER